MFRLRSAAPWLIAAIGAAIAALAAVHFLVELRALDRVVGPLLALVLEVGPAAALVYGGYRLERSGFDPEFQWSVLRWCVAGVVVLVAVVGASVLIRQMEGRHVAEPLFTLLLAASIGGGAGFVAGYYHARVERHARHTAQVNEAFAFVNGVLRHDLRNGLNVVHGQADILAREADAEAAAERAEAIRTQVDESIDLVESAGAIARTLTGDADLERVDLASVADEAATRLRETRDVEVATDLPDSAPVRANEGLRSVANNLLENAVEHNTASDPRVDVAVERGPERVRLRVRDNGPGVPNGGESMFEPRAEGVHGGGLHLVGTLVERYGGEVRVEDDGRPGATFVVELPRADGRRGAPEV